MQFDLGPDPRTETLERTHERLIAHFGRVRRPIEKRRDPVWTLVQGVIGARTKTAVSNENADRILARYGTWEKAAGAPLEALTEMLQTATFPKLMAERLKVCLTEIIAQRGSVMLHHLDNLPTQDAMAWLETLPGVARKIAAGVMNASTFNRKALVIDTHHRRVMQRMGLVHEKADTARAYDALMPVLPKAWTPEDVDEHHLLIKRIGQNFCRPKHINCTACPVRAECQTGLQNK